MLNIEIENIIKQELMSLIEFNNFHGINSENIQNYIVNPYKKMFYNPASEIVETYWVVLNEDFNSEKDGYLVFFSEQDNAFGLATKTNLLDIGEDVGVLLGIYGSLFDCLKAM